MLGHMNFSHYVVFAFGSTSIFANFGLIYLIARYSRPEFGRYKYLMMTFSSFNIIYPLFTLILMPGCHVFGYSFTFYIASPLDKYISQSFGQLMLLYWSILYNKQLILIVFHFLYRYIVVCRFHLMPLFKRQSIQSLLFLYILIDLSLWTWFFESQSWALRANRWYLKEEFHNLYGIDSEKASLLGPLFKYNTSSGAWKYAPYQLLSTTVVMSLVVYKFFVMVWFTIKIHKALKSSLLSHRAKQMQRDLLQALIAQTACPFVMEVVPCLVAHFCALNAIYIGYWCNYFFITVSMFPLLDAISMTYFIRDYRKAVLRNWKKTFSRISMSSVDETPNERRPAKLQPI